MIIVVLSWIKFVVPRRIKPGIFELRITTGKSNFGIVFIFLRCAEKEYYHVVSETQLGIRDLKHRRRMGPRRRRVKLLQDWVEDVVYSVKIKCEYM